MIYKSLEILKKVIQDYLILFPEFDALKEAVILSPVVKEDGSPVTQQDSNSLFITLVRVEEERVLKSQNSISITPEGQMSKVNPEIKLNLFILFSANCQYYETGLKLISAVVRCFQKNNVFTPVNTPDMDPSLQKLIVELYTLSFEEQNHLWGSLGAKYLPSVLYKVRLLTVQEDQKLREGPPISKAEFNGKGI